MVPKKDSHYMPRLHSNKCTFSRLVKCM